MGAAMFSKTLALAGDWFWALLRPSVHTFIKQDTEEGEVQISPDTLVVLRDLPFETLAKRALAAPRLKDFSPLFKQAFWAIVLLTIISILGASLIAFLSDEPLPPNQQAVFDSLGWAWKTGFGAILGLIGGKAM